MNIIEDCKFVLVIAVLLGSAGTSSADVFDDLSENASVGYGSMSGRQITIDDVTARLGMRYGTYIGIEGEASIGVDKAHYIYAPPCNGSVCPQFVALFQAKLSNQEAGYVVGYLPVFPGADLFARLGYGATNIASQAPIGRGGMLQGVNIGVGAQYFIDGVNGLRFDYVHTEFENNDTFGREALGSGSNVWSIAYTRRF